MPLAAIRYNPKLSNLPLIRQSQLSVMPLTKDEFDVIVKMGTGKTDESGSDWLPDDDICKPTSGLRFLRPTSKPVYRSGSAVLSSANELCGQPANRNQNRQVNPVVSAGGHAAVVITDHQKDNRHDHESVLL